MDEAGREWGGVGGKTIAVEGAESEDDADVDAIESLVGVDGKLVLLFIGFRYEIGVLHNGLYFIIIIIDHNILKIIILQWS